MILSEAIELFLSAELSDLTLADQYEIESGALSVETPKERVGRKPGTFPDSTVKAKDLEFNKGGRVKKQSGSMLVPIEMEDMPVDTYTPEEQANAEATQLPDPKMEEQYLEFIVEESLQEEEQDYLMEALEKDPRLSEILDKVVMTASEFSGAGEVDGPGTGVSDSIPTRLSDGEFVITEKATSMLGADNLQRMMDDAERMADGGAMMRETRQIGGMLGMPKNPEEELESMSQMRSTDDEVNQMMLRSNQVPSLRRY